MVHKENAMEKIKKLAELKKNVIGTWVSLSDPSLVEFVKWAGFDFVCLDNEYFPFDPDKMAQMIRTANNMEIPIIIRISRMEDISTLINTGADGIMIPDCTFERAREAVRRIKYAPIGMRSMFATNRAMRVSGLDFKEYHKQANDHIAVVVQIEGKEGMADLDKILSLEGVDLICTGRYDISQSLGVSCEANHPLVDEFEDIVIKKTFQYGKIPILGASTEKEAQDIFIKQKVPMAIVSRDIAFLMNGMTALLKSLKR
jgi:4-hydroxy-2-oxoheptanedioate aldolase